MKIKCIDKVCENGSLTYMKPYKIIKSFISRDDKYYVVKNNNGVYTTVHELICKVTK